MVFIPGAQCATGGCTNRQKGMSRREVHFESSFAPGRCTRCIEEIDCPPFLRADRVVATDMILTDHSGVRQVVIPEAIDAKTIQITFEGGLIQFYGPDDLLPCRNSLSGAGVSS